MDFAVIRKCAHEAPRSVVRGVQRATASLRRAVRATDIWIQDHHVAVVSGGLGVLLPSVGTLLWTRWDDVVAVAKELAPVLSVLAVTLGALASTVKWLRKRRATRLTAQAQVIELPPAGMGSEQAARAGAPASAADGAPDAA